MKYIAFVYQCTQSLHRLQGYAHMLSADTYPWKTRLVVLVSDRFFMFLCMWYNLCNRNSSICFFFLLVTPLFLSCSSRILHGFKQIESQAALVTWIILWFPMSPNPYQNLTVFSFLIRYVLTYENSVTYAWLDCSKATAV